MAKWNDASLPWGAHNDEGDSLDLWGVINGKYEEGWFVPSKAEWSAFGDYLYKFPDYPENHSKNLSIEELPF